MDDMTPLELLSEAFGADVWSHVRTDDWRYENRWDDDAGCAVGCSQATQARELVEDLGGTDVTVRSTSMWIDGEGGPAYEIAFQKDGQQLYAIICVEFGVAYVSDYELLARNFS